jgi:hypothetical protein
MIEEAPLRGDTQRRAEQDSNRLALESVYKFRFFFTALVFAILSFAIQFPVDTRSVWIKSAEAGSWALLLTAGCLALRDCGGFRADLSPVGLSNGWRRLMWALFVVAIVLLLLAKIFVSFGVAEGAH